MILRGRGRGLEPGCGSSASKSRRATEDDPLWRTLWRTLLAWTRENETSSLQPQPGAAKPRTSRTASQHARGAPRPCRTSCDGFVPSTRSCTRRGRACTTSAQHETPSGATSPNRGWRVVVDASLLEVAPVDEDQLHAAVAKAEPRLVREHGVGPRAECRVSVEGTRTRWIGGKVSVVTKVDHDGPPATFEVLAGSTDVSVKPAAEPPAPL